MKGVARARATRQEIGFAVGVLKELSHHIDNEAKCAVTRTRKWFLDQARSEWIATDAVQRMQAVERVIRELFQWAAVLETPSPSKVEQEPASTEGPIPDRCARLK